MPRLFLDCDGVLADFDSGAALVLGMHPQRYRARYGNGAFWRALQQEHGLYATLRPMPNARRLYEALRHHRPVILTGVPDSFARRAAEDKRLWCAAHFPGTPIICCRSEYKRDFISGPGDVLVDDRERYADLWRAAGGVFVLHRDDAWRDTVQRANEALRRAIPRAGRTGAMSETPISSQRSATCPTCGARPGEPCTKRLVTGRVCRWDRRVEVDYIHAARKKETECS